MNITAMLDRMAAAVTHPRPLQVDPDLWEAFADDRAANTTTTCAGTCGRQLRDRAQHHDDPTVPAVSSIGMCSTCYRQHRADGGRILAVRQHITPGQLCAGNCQHPLRPTKMTPTDAPGTRRHQADGYCQPCHHARKATQ